MSPRSSTRRPIRPRKKAPERTKPARGRDGNRRSRRQSPVVNQGEPARAIFGGVRHVGIARKGDFLSGEGGIRTLEAGISPPNALAGRRLQPLGHFSGRAHRTAALCTRKPAGAGFREAEGEGFEPSMHLSAHTRFPVALLRPLGHPSIWSRKADASVRRRPARPERKRSRQGDLRARWRINSQGLGHICRQSSKFDFEKGLEQT